MSNIGSATTLAPTPQPYDAIRALLRAGRNDDAIVKLSAIIVTRPSDLVAKELLFDAFFQKRDWPPAFALAEELVRRQPNVPRLQKALIATLSNMKRYEETITQAFQYIVRYGEDLTMLDALKIAYFYTGKVEEAIRYGQRALELRDEVLRVMRQLAEEGMTMIVVTHEMQFARDMADLVLFFDDGRVAESGPPEQIFSEPRNERTREFLRRTLTR